MPIRLLISVFTIFLLSFTSKVFSGQEELKDLYFGEALYNAYQEDWFDAISRLDTELAQYHGIDEPELDTLYYHINHARFAVGDFELAYRMHQRAGRAITAVIEGNVEEPVRNEAIYRLANIYFQKDQPGNALYAVERISGEIPEDIRDDIEFLKAQIYMVNGCFSEAADILLGLQDSRGLEGFATYNLAVALLKDGNELDGRKYLDKAGLIETDNSLALAIKDKANIALGDKLLEERSFENAKLVLDRVRLTGPLSSRALLGSGWADASQDNFKNAIVPWSLLVTGQVTDSSVQEGLLALPYAYGKLNVYSKAALLYGDALGKFSAEIDRLEASIKSIRKGNFLKALVREEIKQDSNWVVKLRKLPGTPETYYLLDLMASHDFQESLKNFLDLEQLRKKLDSWQTDLSAFEDIIEKRRAYYEPLLPSIDHEFRKLDSNIRLRLEQRDHIKKRLENMRIVPRPDYLATTEERVVGENLIRLENRLKAEGEEVPGEIIERIKRLRGVINWNVYTDYDRRYTEAYIHLRDLDQVVLNLKKQYTDFVRTRQAATQSYQGYEDEIRRLRWQIKDASEKVGVLMMRQGNMIETMAVEELSKRREHLAEFQIKARFAMADSYDRATRDQAQAKAEK
ncbi:MAG: hypothetical protein JXA35_05390 [Deltaproteobacteria bacterium]|nr:hypothetical protein [Deltaproteobacteria bacterium]